MKQQLIRFHWLLSSQFGLDPLRFIRSLRGLMTYWYERRQFRQIYSGKMLFMPCLHDKFEEAGITRSEYFWQDLLVARWIFEAKPEKHVDIGSRLDGFVAHVASFREIEVFDIRSIATQIPGVIFRQADLTKPLDSNEGYCDSVSCLHALEHFGLGRYGDTIDSKGYQHGIANMAKFLCSGGRLYLSTPIGQERVEFNANWVFNPRIILDLAERNSLALERLSVLGRNNRRTREIEATPDALEELAIQQYHLGIFVFSKK